MAVDRHQNLIEILSSKSVILRCRAHGSPLLAAGISDDAVTEPTKPTDWVDFPIPFDLIKDYPSLSLPVSERWKQQRSTSSTPSTENLLVNGNGNNNGMENNNNDGGKGIIMLREFSASAVCYFIRWQYEVALGCSKFTVSLKSSKNVLKSLFDIVVLSSESNLHQRVTHEFRELKPLMELYGNITLEDAEQLLLFADFHDVKNLKTIAEILCTIKFAEAVHQATDHKIDFTLYSDFLALCRQSNAKNVVKLLTGDEEMLLNNVDCSMPDLLRMLKDDKSDCWKGRNDVPDDIFSAFAWTKVMFGFGFQRTDECALQLQSLHDMQIVNPSCAFMFDLAIYNLLIVVRDEDVDLFGLRKPAQPLCKRFAGLIHDSALKRHIRCVEHRWRRPVLFRIAEPFCSDKEEKGSGDRPCPPSEFRARLVSRKKGAWRLALRRHMHVGDPKWLIGGRKFYICEGDATDIHKSATTAAAATTANKWVLISPQQSNGIGAALMFAFEYYHLRDVKKEYTVRPVWSTC